MPFAKGQSGNPSGRRKGLPNKVTAAVKDMVIQALSEAGGVSYLKRQANDNPGAFMTLVGKVIPLQVGGDPNSPVSYVHRIELVAPRRAGVIDVRLTEPE